MSRKPYSRYSNYWYGVVLKMVQIYPLLGDHETDQVEKIRDAIEKSIEQTKQLPDGVERVKAVRMLYFDKTHTIDGIALESYVSRRTVQQWTNDFIRLVGKNAGYM